MKAPGRFLAVIPARGGSKGVPGKNLRAIGGRSLIGRAIDAARGCLRIERCVVTTDDPAIRAAALAEGVEVVDRPAELATDTAPTHAAVRHTLEVLAATGPLSPYLVLLQPTSPLRTSADLDACLGVFLASGAASILSVTEVEHHPYKDFLLEDGYLVPLFSEERLERPRQSLPPVYRPNGAIYALATALFLERGGFYAPPALPYAMPAAASVDVDSALDLALAELIVSGTG